MAIEVKQMIIKSTLIHGHNEPHSDVLDVDIVLLKEEVMEECRELIEQSFRKLGER
ncbi:MAG: hypothetical protein ACJASL_003481 [Paraglaciecola sp.]|jgi:hypothetical protein